MDTTVDHDTADALVLREDHSGIATITLNRPDKFNALSGALMSTIEQTLSDIAADTSVRVVVLAANGKAFSAGHDLKELGGKQGRDEIDALFRQCSRMMLAITHLPQPVIARIHGIATAAGCQLAATCDLAVASTAARFATSGINVGLFCATPGVALSRNVPRKKAMEMLLTGDFIDAETARDLGLVNQVVAPEELDGAVQALAAKIAARSPVAVTMGKELFYRQLEGGLEAAYAAAVDTIVCNMVDGEAADGINAFVSKQPMPKWRDR